MVAAGVLLTLELPWALPHGSLQWDPWDGGSGGVPAHLMPPGWGHMLPGCPHSWHVPSLLRRSMAFDLHLPEEL